MKTIEAYQIASGILAAKDQPTAFPRSEAFLLAKWVKDLVVPTLSMGGFPFGHKLDNAGVAAVSLLQKEARYLSKYEKRVLAALLLVESEDK